MNMPGMPVVAAAFCALTASAQAGVIVYVRPSADQVLPGESFTVQLRADIDQPVVAWGLDLAFNSAVVQRSGPPAIGPAWFPAYAPDGDGLAGVAFPVPVVGANTLLATIVFEALTPGTCPLAASFTPGDLNEGFALDPVGFAQVSFIPASVTVLPEPGLLLPAALPWIARRRRPVSRPAC